MNKQLVILIFMTFSSLLVSSEKQTHNASEETARINARERNRKIEMIKEYVSQKHGPKKAASLKNMSDKQIDDIYYHVMVQTSKHPGYF